MAECGLTFEALKATVHTRNALHSITIEMFRSVSSSTRALSTPSTSGRVSSEAIPHIRLPAHSLRPASLKVSHPIRSSLLLPGLVSGCAARSVRVQAEQTPPSNPGENFTLVVRFVSFPSFFCTSTALPQSQNDKQYILTSNIATRAGHLQETDQVPYRVHHFDRHPPLRHGQDDLPEAVGAQSEPRSGGHRASCHADLRAAYTVHRVPSPGNR